MEVALHIRIPEIEYRGNIPIFGQVMWLQSQSVHCNGFVADRPDVENSM